MAHPLSSEMIPRNKSLEWERNQISGRHNPLLWTKDGNMSTDIGWTLVKNSKGIFVHEYQVKLSLREYLEKQGEFWITTLKIGEFVKIQKHISSNGFPKEMGTS